jgi:tetratricopeptide (TPR) repeat protein
MENDFEYIKEFGQVLEDFNRNSVKDVIPRLEKIIEKYPNQAEPYFWLGLCYEKLNYSENAAGLYEKYLCIEPEKPKDAGILADVYYRLGSIYLSKKNYAKAIENYTKAIKLSPSSTYYLARAEAYECIGDFKAAKRDFNKTKFYWRFLRGLKTDLKYVFGRVREEMKYELKNLYQILKIYTKNI